MRHLLSVDDLSRRRIESLFQTADALTAMPIARRSALLHGRVVVTMFVEPSTRTRLSFESAALRLGAGVTGFSEAMSTSMKKGESLEDTARVCEGYGDALVLRHPDVGSAARAASVVSCPVINAGDGANEHPTQTLVDMYAMSRAFGRIDGLRVGFCGDLRYGRTVHSLLAAMQKFEGMSAHLLPAIGLELPDTRASRARAAGVTLHEAKSLAELAQTVDVLYMTRIQTERMDGAEGPQPICLTTEHLRGVSPAMRVMHPLPRREEIHPGVDATPHAMYFEQAHAGVPVRQAVLLDVLGVSLSESP